jgi:hypothetical protein
MATSPSPAPDEPEAPPATPLPAPRVRIRMPAMPAVRVRRATALETFFENFRSTVLSEETVVLLEFLIVIVIGIVAFFTVYPTFKSAVDSIAVYLNKQFGTTF